MKKWKLILSLSVICLNLFSQTDKPKVQAIEVPKTHFDIYYISQTPRIVNGKAFTGTDSSYFMEANEKLLAVETFKDGFKIELKTFYDNGNSEVHYQWKDGKRNGVRKKWYKSGKIMFDYIEKDGEIVGTYISFYENGNPRFIDDKRNTGINMEFYENGKLHSLFRHFKDSTKCGNMDGFEETSWHENGQLMVKRIENCGRQSFTCYYNDSTIFSQGTEVGMSIFRVGRYTEWYLNKKVKLEAYYDEQKANSKTGIWKYYNEKGQLTKEEYYENDKLIKTNDYLNGKKVTKIKG